MKSGLEYEALSAVLSGQTITYRLVRARRRTIGFVIDDVSVAKFPPGVVSW